MKKYISISILASVFLFSVISLSDSVIKEFRAEPGMNKVHLTWLVSLETDVSGYKVLRGFDPTQLRNLEFLETNNIAIPPGGTKKYDFTDQSVFKTDGRSFYYQIAVLNTEGQTVTTTEIREVSPNISSVRHTWGSIKAMFR